VKSVTVAAICDIMAENGQLRATLSRVEAEKDAALAKLEEERQLTDAARKRATGMAQSADTYRVRAEAAESLLTSLCTTLGCSQEELVGRVGELREENSRLNSWVENDREIFIALGFPDPPGPTLVDARNLAANLYAAGQTDMLSTVKRLMEEADMAHRCYDETWYHFEDAIKSLPIKERREVG